LPGCHPFINAGVRGFSAYKKLILRDTDICAFRNAITGHVFLKFSVNCTMWKQHRFFIVNNLCCSVQGFSSCKCQHK